MKASAVVRSIYTEFLFPKTHFKVNSVVLGHISIHCKLQLSELKREKGGGKQIPFFFPFGTLFSGAKITTCSQ